MSDYDKDDGLDDSYEEVNEPSGAYGFGPREGKLVQEMYTMFHDFANTFDIPLTELIGVNRIAIGILIRSMVHLEVTTEDEE